MRNYKYIPLASQIAKVAKKDVLTTIDLISSHYDRFTYILIENDQFYKSIVILIMLTS